MKTLQRVFCLLILSLFILVPSFGQCNELNNSKQISTNFGSLELPNNSYIIKYDFTDIFSDNKQDDEYSDFQRTKMKAFLDMFTVYQVVIKDGENYNNAFLVSMFLDKTMLKGMGFKEENKTFLQGGMKLSPEDKNAITLMQDYAKIEIEKLSAEYREKHYNTEKVHKITFDSLKEFSENPPGIIAFSWPEVEQILINGETGYQTEVRFASNLIGILSSFYVNAYTFNVQDDGIAVVFIYTQDSERKFWSDILNQSVKETVSFKEKI